MALPTMMETNVEKSLDYPKKCIPTQVIAGLREKSIPLSSKKIIQDSLETFTVYRKWKVQSHRFLQFPLHLESQVRPSPSFSYFVGKVKEPQQQSAVAFPILCNIFSAENSLSIPCLKNKPISLQSHYRTCTREKGVYITFPSPRPLFTECMLKVGQVVCSPPEVQEFSLNG